MTLGQFLDKLVEYVYNVDIYFDHEVIYTGAEVYPGHDENNNEIIQFLDDEYQKEVLKVNKNIEVQILTNSVFIPDYKGKRIDFYFFKTEMINCLIESLDNKC